MKNERTCIACRKKQDKSLMLKLVKNKNGTISIDEKQKLEGRGAYVCNNKDCLNKLIKTKALNRSYKSAIDADIYDKIGEIVSDK